MEDEVELYVKTCLICQQDKIDRRKQASLLQPFPIPEMSCVSLSMDFILGFSVTLEIYFKNDLNLLLDI